jgi:hypothetical protein
MKRATTRPAAWRPSGLAMLMGCTLAWAELPAAAEGLTDTSTQMAAALKAVGDALARSNAAKLQLGQQPAGGTADAAAQNAVASGTLAVEQGLQDAYLEIEHACAVNMRSLQTALATDERKGAHVNAWGGLLALVGGVTVYAPAKAVLMGIGISSSGGSSSVLGGLASSVGKRTESSTQAMRTLKQAYASAVDGYEAILPEKDPGGTKRFSALVRLRAACDGLLEVAVDPPA